MHRRLFNDINTLRTRIGALEKREAEDPYVPTPTGSLNLSASLIGVNGKGDLLIAGTGSHAEIRGSHLVYLDPTKQWRRATGGVINSGSSELIGIALSATPHTNGIMIQGVFNLSSSYVSGALGDGSGREGTFTVGAQVYMHPTVSGSFTTSIPSGSNQAVRVVGHSIDTEVIYFNPSKDFIEL